MQPVGLYYFNKPKRSSLTSARVSTTSHPELTNPVITIIAPSGEVIPMDRTEAVVTYLALGVALKANIQRHVDTICRPL